MKEKEILEGNKLIAEFMGWRKDATHGWLQKDEKDSWNFRDDYVLRYYVSWDWLIPVMEKICECGCVFEIWKSLGGGCRICKVGGKYEEAKSFHAESNSIQEAVWYNAIDFIKWYNQKYKRIEAVPPILNEGDGKNK